MRIEVVGMTVAQYRAAMCMPMSLGEWGHLHHNCRAAMERHGYVERQTGDMIALTDVGLEAMKTNIQYKIVKDDTDRKIGSTPMSKARWLDIVFRGLAKKAASEGAKPLPMSFHE